MAFMPVCNIECAFLDHGIDHLPNFHHNLAILEPGNALTSHTKMAIDFDGIVRMTSERSQIKGKSKYLIHKS